MKRLSILLLLTCTLTFCHSHSKIRVPDNIIKPDTMVNILADVHLLQASLQLGYVEHDTSITGRKAFENIWKKHSITEDDYNRSMKYYSSQPPVLDSIYEKVLNNLEQQKAELMGKQHK